MSAQREFCMAYLESQKHIDSVVAPTNIQVGGQILKIEYFCHYIGFTDTITIIICMK